MMSIMDELKQEIDALKARISEKEAEIQTLKHSLSQLELRLNSAIRDAVKQEKDEQAALAAEQEQARLNAEAEAKAREEEAQERARLEEEQREQAEREAQAKAKAERQAAAAQEPEALEEEVADTEIAEPAIGAAEHEAIMRTIEELSKPLGVSHARTAEDRYTERASVGDKVAKSQVNDLKRAMGINERFLYANELFGGDMEAFSRAVEELNHVETEVDANRLLDENLAAKYRWNEEDETVVAFKSLVSRRFV